MAQSRNLAFTSLETDVLGSRATAQAVSQQEVTESQPWTPSFAQPSAPHAINPPGPVEAVPEHGIPAHPLGDSDNHNAQWGNIQVLFKGL